MINHVTEKSSFLQIKMGHHPKLLRFLSVLRIVFGSIMLTLGLASAVFPTDFTSYVGFGIWVGVWIIATGILGCYASRDPRVPASKCLLGTFMGFTITACVFAGTMLICYSIALDGLADDLRCYNRKRLLDKYNKSDENFVIINYHTYVYSHYCGHASYSRVKAGVGIDSVLLLISVLEFAVSLASLIYCCTAICTCPCCDGTSRVQGTREVVYYLQPGMGQVSMTGGGMVVMSGGPPATVVEPSAAQFIIQQPGQLYKGQEAPPAYTETE